VPTDKQSPNNNNAKSDLVLLIIVLSSFIFPGLK